MLSKCKCSLVPRNSQKQILDLVEASRAGVAYSELTLIDELKGDCCLGHPRFPLVLYWEGLSEDAAEAILELTREG